MLVVEQISGQPALRAGFDHRLDHSQLVGADRAWGFLFEHLTHLFVQRFLRFMSSFIELFQSEAIPVPARTAEVTLLRTS